MDNKDSEHYEKAAQLWHSGLDLLENKNIVRYLENIKQFHDYLSEQGLLNDPEVKTVIQRKASKIKDETFLYRIMSVMSYLSRNSSDDSVTRHNISTLKRLVDFFLEFSEQKKFSPDTKKNTIETDQKITADIFLYCGLVKIIQDISNNMDESKSKEELLQRLTTLNSLDTIVDFYKKYLHFIGHESDLVTLETYAHKAFIIEHSHNSEANKLVDNPICNRAIGSENAVELRDLRTEVEKEYLHRFSKMPEEEKLTAADSIISRRHSQEDSPNHSPRKLSGFVQDIIHELLRGNAYKITPKMQELSTQTLIIIKKVVDQQLEKTPKPRRDSVAAIAKSYISGDARRRSSLDLATRNLDNAINKSPTLDARKETTKK